MSLLSPTRKLWVLPGAAHLCASPSNRSLLPPSSTTVFATLFRRSQFPRARCHVSCPAAQSRHRLTPLLPTIEFAYRPRPPQPRAVTSKRLYPTPAEPPPFAPSLPHTPLPDNAPVH